MAGQPVSIGPGDVAAGFNSDTVVLTSPALVDGLIHDQAGALAFLAEEAAPVEVTDLTVDALGRVVIRNQPFVDALKAKLEREASSTNYICGWRCNLA